jgi:hypothetical protein
MFVLVCLMTLGWLLAICGWLLAYRIDQHWIKSYNKLVKEDNELVEQHNILVRGYNELLNIHKILIDFLKTADQTPANQPQTSNKKRVLN